MMMLMITIMIPIILHFTLTLPVSLFRSQESIEAQHGSVSLVEPRLVVE